MLRVFNHMVPYPRPKGFLVPDPEVYKGLDAIQQHGTATSDLAQRTGRVRCLAITQQDKLREELAYLKECQLHDHARMDEDYGMRMQGCNMQFWPGGLGSSAADMYPRKMSNNDILMAKRIEKCYRRRMKELKEEKRKNAIWLDLWYDKQVVKVDRLLRKEWDQSGECEGYPYWAAERREVKRSANENGFFKSLLLDFYGRKRIIVNFEECHRHLEDLDLDFMDEEEDIVGLASLDLRLDDAALLRWGWFNVEEVHLVTFNDDGFENLVLPSHKKQLLSSLIMSQNLEGFSTDDFVEEVMADHARRPLLTANSGQFIGSPAEVEVSLAKLLQSATRWGALVLLDEADVFMQARNLQDLERNGIISMLLRTLEYFEGTLFLTTNRVGTIDSAFMSRIHLALSYEPLSEAARRQLWDTWITRACRGQRPIWVKEELLVQLSVLNVSGRDIKNISLLAQGLAKTGQRDMASEDIWKGVNAMTQFQEDFRVSVTRQEAGKRSDPKVPDSNPMPSKSWLKTLYQWWWS
ncbi:ATPase [Colletotrichum cuscutae]|uniref:ATPase n=1 Tax=Colletotrichum cuscutae TaxID=1209917 RepID=A0AAI9VC79_9PEZI|nr:ATPase [Colletotrichum cuscutae]